jgi:hypothetical protein
MFGGGVHRCDARVAGEGLAVGRCGCAGYTTDRAAFGEPIDTVDVVELRLRRPGEQVAGAPRLASARDLFDEGERLRGPNEPLPWRPAS